jgi:hypothetical protein
MEKLELAIAYFERWIRLSTLCSYLNPFNGCENITPTFFKIRRSIEKENVLI